MLDSSIKHRLWELGIPQLPIRAEVFSDQATLKFEGHSRPIVIVDPAAYDGKVFTLVQDFGWQDYQHGSLRVRAGYRFNGASVPRPGRFIIDRTECGLLATLYHDALYETKGDLTLYGIGYQRKFRFSRKEADVLFLDHMIEDNVKWWKRELAYRTVRLAGASHWGVPL